VLDNVDRKPSEKRTKSFIIGFLCFDLTSVCFVKADVVMHDAVINDEIDVRHLRCNFVRDSHSSKECVILFHYNDAFPVVAKLVEKVGRGICDKIGDSIEPFIIVIEGMVENRGILVRTAR
jgi:hypothetical protein